MFSHPEEGRNSCFIMPVTWEDRHHNSFFPVFIAEHNGTLSGISLRSTGVIVLALLSPASCAAPSLLAGGGQHEKQQRTAFVLCKQ